MQFHPLAYIVKLNIELSMADLISKIVRRADRIDATNSASHPTELKSYTHHQRSELEEGVFTTSAQVSHIYANGGNSNEHLDENVGAYSGDGGIMKTIVTVVKSADKDRNDSITSSTKQLNTVESIDRIEVCGSHRDECYLVWCWGVEKRKKKISQINE